MVNAVSLGLVNNAALLLSLALLYEFSGIRAKDSGSIPHQLLSGFILGAIGIAIMLNPWTFGQGILFDTRSVLLAITGFFFGTLPVLLAVLCTGAFRLFLGGDGALVGTGVIVTSGTIGLAWRHLRLKRGKEATFGELLGLGLVVHLAMLAWMFLLPWPTASAVLQHISLPVLLIYPLATAILGKLLENRRRHTVSRHGLEQSEEKFRAIFQLHSAPKLLVDTATGMIIEANAAAENLYGWPAARLRKMSLQDIAAEDFVQSEAGASRRESRHTTASGAVKDVEIYSSPIVIDGSVFQHSIIHDISERKEKERQLGERQRFLSRTIQTTLDGFLVTDAAGTVTEVNDAYCAMSGYPRGKIIGRHISAFDALESEEETVERIALIKDRGALLFESSHHHAEKGVFPVEISVSYIAEDNGKFVCFCRDLSERRRQEEHLAALGEMLDAAPTGVLLHDRSGRLLFVNQAIVKMHGYTDRQEFLRHNLLDFLAPEVKENFSRRIDRIAQEGELHFESVHFDRTGEAFPVDVIVRMIEWQGSQAYLSINTDISEQKKSQEAVTHSNELLRYIIEHANSAIAVHDRDLRYIYVSRNYLEQYKVNESDVIGRHHYDVFPDLPRKWREVHQRALRGEVSGAERDPYPRADGSLEWTRWSCRPWYEPDGGIGGFIVYTEVITEMVQAEMVLREREEYLRAMIAAAPLAILSLDLHGTVQSWNRAARQIFGWSEGEMLGKPLPFTDRKEEKEFTSLFNRACGGESLSNIELRQGRKDGSAVDLSLSLAPINDDGGGITGILAILEDISARKRMEKERDELQNQLLQAQKMESVGRLAGGVAHDYNNMLGVILGYSEMALERLYEEEPLYTELQEIKSAAERSAEITRQLLAFSRQQPISPTVIDLNGKVADLIQMIRRLIGEDIDLVWQPGDPLAPIYMDAVQLDQVLLNLCINARDAITGAGTITISTAMSALDEAYCREHYGFLPGEFVSLSVSDNGCGMDRDTREKVFEPFFTTKILGKGTGLGLATVYGILKQNDCFINVYSDPGQGSTFTVFFPQYQAQEAVAEATAAKGPPATSGRETILLIEDEPAILAMTRSMLERLGYTVHACSTPGEALEVAQEQGGDIDLLLTDVVMPEMSGSELAARLQEQYPELKTLFMSGYTADSIADRGVLDRGVSFIQKPFTRSSLADKVREVIDSRVRISQ